jgi:hypothetical protein
MCCNYTTAIILIESGVYFNPFFILVVHTRGDLQTKIVPKIVPGACKRVNFVISQFLDYVQGLSVCFAGNLQIYTHRGRIEDEFCYYHDRH